MVRTGIGEGVKLVASAVGFRWNSGADMAIAEAGRNPSPILRAYASCGVREPSPATDRTLDSGVDA